ncbi:receptor-like protein kinase FERONIA [Impatiens glandulifera]|uniref:receptor-like protein kinase FERONIA n=1 Tax=Impatiens glandulifera TaxID=253017 RepID=UPI001FB0F8E5|nr:receptor-like protein kinase FERONIA [Impatiens glandulifera]
MDLIVITLLLLQLCSILTAAIAYKPTEVIRLDCGAIADSISPDKRPWIPDSGSKFMPPPLTSSSVSKADQQSSSVEQIPYLSARIFPSQFTYTFPLSSGPKFLRLYFYSANYSGRDITKSFFTVSAAGHTLLANFSVFLSSPANSPSFVKEFVVHVENSQTLQLTFTPTSSVDSYAFINGIEIVSMPDNLYFNSPNTTLVGGQNTTTFIVDTSTALETLYRINVGGQSIDVQNDTGMFRKWDNDIQYQGNLMGKEPYLNFTVLYNNRTPAYTAPGYVYTTQLSMGPSQNNLQFNISWIFSVDSGFSYLLRLHFCEIIIQIDGNNQRVFTVFLGDQIADKSVDVFRRAGGRDIPIFSDYVVSVPVGNDGIPTKHYLSLSLCPNIDSRPRYIDTLLSGVEILKLNKSDGSLAGPNPAEALSPTVSGSNPQVLGNQKRKGPSSSLLGAIVGGVVGGIAVIAIMAFLILKKRMKTGEKKMNPGLIMFGRKTIPTVKLNLNLGLRLSLEDIKSATNNFNEELLIGKGGFGKVYKGMLKNGTMVAVKRSSDEHGQGISEFQIEILILSKIRHRNLVSLIGYCEEGSEMILVYEFVENGTLREHLYVSDKMSKTSSPKSELSWIQRLNICIGAAKGLHYLHTELGAGIIHRDIKSTNILLDDSFNAKVADFGLARQGLDPDQIHVTTVVKGSFGYMDPEYYRCHHLTRKSDVYSFGVVLLEVLCARAAVDNSVPFEEISLVTWGLSMIEQGRIDEIVDSSIVGEVKPVSLSKFVETIEKCLRKCGLDRPNMRDVLRELEYALQLQQMEKPIDPMHENSALDISLVDELSDEVKVYGVTLET